MKCTKHYHLIDLPSGRRIRTNKDCNTDSLGDDEELGFSLGKLLKGAVSIAAPIAGGVVGGPMGAMIGAQAGKIAGKIIPQGKKKGGAPQVSAEPGVVVPTGQVVSTPSESISKEDIKNQILSALKEYRNNQAGTKESAKVITSRLTPQLDSILALAKTAALKQQVTNEHNIKVQESNRWKDSAAKQAKILARLDALEKKLDARAIHNRTIAASFGIPGKYT